MTTPTKVQQSSIIEIWKPIKGFEKSHMVSNYGRIKSLSRKIKNQYSFRVSNEKILKHKISTVGYPTIQLEQRGRSFSIHRLVCESFLPNPENKEVVNHKNGIKADNRLKNLEWNTRSENQLHAYETGLQIPGTHDRAKGENQAHSKLKTEDVIWIKANYAEGQGVTIAKKFGVSHTSISNIINGKTWKDV